MECPGAASGTGMDEGAARAWSKCAAMVLRTAVVRRRWLWVAGAPRAAPRPQQQGSGVPGCLRTLVTHRPGRPPATLHCCCGRSGPGTAPWAGRPAAIRARAMIRSVQALWSSAAASSPVLCPAVTGPSPTSSEGLSAGQPSDRADQRATTGTQSDYGHPGQPWEPEWPMTVPARTLQVRTGLVDQPPEAAPKMSWSRPPALGQVSAVNGAVLPRHCSTSKPSPPL